jgi:hypothetical protein
LASLRLKWFAAAAVLLLHAFFYHLLNRPQGASRAAGPVREVMRVEFIERAPPADIAPLPVRPREAAAVKPQRTRPAAMPEDAPRRDAAPSAMSAEPLVLDWKEAEASDPSYRLNLPEDDSPESLAMASPDRIRVRRRLNGQDVIEGTAQALGLWPPGYESDPCPRVKRNIANGMTDTSERGRKQLADDLRRQRVVCLQ